jgi:hypothetical protein
MICNLITSCTIDRGRGAHPYQVLSQIYVLPEDIQCTPELVHFQYPMPNTSSRWQAVRYSTWKLKDRSIVDSILTDIALLGVL